MAKRKESLSRRQILRYLRKERRAVWKNYHEISNSPLLNRLADITQVMVIRKDSNTRTRLSHTFDVVWLIRTIGPRIKDIFPEVGETIAIAHDLGHTPYGHDAEKEIRKYLDDPNFSHAKMGARIAKLMGLKLHPWVEYGVIHHSDGDHLLNVEMVYSLEEKWKKTANYVAVLDDIACAVSDIIDIIRETGDAKPVVVGMLYKAVDMVMADAELCRAIAKVIGISADKQLKEPGNIEHAHTFLLAAFAEVIVRSSRGKNGIHMEKPWYDLFTDMKRFVYEQFHTDPEVREVRDERVSGLMQVVYQVEEEIKENKKKSTQINGDVRKFYKSANYEGEQTSREQKVIDFICNRKETHIEAYVAELV